MYVFLNGGSTFTENLLLVDNWVRFYKTIVKVLIDDLISFDECRCLR